MKISTLLLLLSISFFISCKDSEEISKNEISEKLTKVPSSVSFSQNGFEMKYELEKQQDNIFVNIIEATFFEWPAYEISLQENGGFNINGEIICKDGKLTKYYEYDNIKYLEDRINFTTDNDEVIFSFYLENDNIKKFVREYVVFVNGDPVEIKREIELSYTQKVNTLNPFWAKYRFSDSALKTLDLILFYSVNIPETGTETIYYNGEPSSPKQLSFDFQTNSDNSINEYSVGIENVESTTWNIEYSL